MTSKSLPLIACVLVLQMQVPASSADERPADTAASVMKQARAALELDHYAEAEKLFKQAIQLDETTYGAHSGQCASDRSDLARLYLNQGLYDQAQELYQSALADLEAQNPPSQPDLATAMSNLAWCYVSQQKLGAAQDLLNKALAIRTKYYGGEDPAVARSLSNLADIHILRGEYDQAETYVKNALSIETAALPPSHPDIATNLRSLALIQESKKDYAAAEVTYRKLLAFDADFEVPEATLAADLDATVKVLRAQSKTDQAQDYESKASILKSKVPGLASAPAVVIEPNGKANEPPFSSGCPINDKWALVVGISNFQDPSLNLKFASKDATDFRNYLVNEAHFQPDHVKLLTDKQATRQSIVDNLGDHWLKRLANPSDLVVIYLSTHGSSAKQETGNANFIVPYDGNLENIVFNGIPMQWLTAGIKDLVHCNRIVLVMDVCHGGAIADGGKGMRRTEIELDPHKILTGEGQIVVASSQADQISWESTEYPNGVFTHRLLEGLRRQGDKTTLKDAYGYMREKVTEEVLRDRAHFQTPVLVTKWWQGDDIAIGVKPVNPRPGLAAAPHPAQQPARSKKQ